jgi:hypothetical protein
LPGIHLTRHFASPYEYLDAIQNGTAHRSHSFDAIDVGPYHGALDEAKVNSLFGFSGFDVTGTFLVPQLDAGSGSMHDPTTGAILVDAAGNPLRAPGRPIYLKYFKVAVSKNGSSTQSSCVGNHRSIYKGLRFQAPHETSELDMRTFSQPLIENYCQGITQAMDAADSHTDMNALVTRYSQDWLTNQGLQLAPDGVQPSTNNAWFEFAGLINLAKENSTNPLIVSLQSNVIQGPVVYKGYFPALGGKALVNPAEATADRRNIARNDPDWVGF